jgi:hypothetical protein
VAFLGERYLHAWISHQFSGQPGPALALVARARQFSSFILLVGRIASAELFEPRFGIIVQNKDLLKIPLMLEQIPTPKEFRDAIESLSPEQQRFARAYRGMQLESTLFGVCVIISQLEKLLKVEPDSLTKEIKLTQELLELFIEYQLPSDLLSYDGPADAPGDLKLARVKEYVGRMQEMIQRSKQRQLEEEQQRGAWRAGTARAAGAKFVGAGRLRARRRVRRSAADAGWRAALPLRARARSRRRTPAMAPLRCRAAPPPPPLPEAAPWLDHAEAPDDQLRRWPARREGGLQRLPGELRPEVRGARRCATITNPGEP